MWMYLSLVLIFVVMILLVFLAVAGPRRTINLLRSKLAGPGGGVWVEKWFKDGSRDQYFTRKLGSTIPFKTIDEQGKKKEEQVQIGRVIHADRPTRQPLIVAVQGHLETVDMRERYKPDESTKLLNQALIEAYHRGVQDVQDLFDAKQKSAVIMYVGAAALALLCIVSAYYAWQNNEILVQTLTQLQPYMEMAQQAVDSGVVGEILENPK